MAQVVAKRYAFRSGVDQGTMTKRRLKPRNLAAVLTFLGVAAICAGDVACSAPCGSPADGPFPLVVFYLDCSVSDFPSVTLSGSCAGGSAIRNGDDSITISGDMPGVCHVKMTFVGGFIYSADVAFKSMGSPDSCGNGVSLVPTQSVFEVNNPSSTCVDGGSAAGAGG